MRWSLVLDNSIAYMGSWTLLTLMRSCHHLHVNKQQTGTCKYIVWYLTQCTIQEHTLFLDATLKSLSKLDVFDVSDETSKSSPLVPPSVFVPSELSLSVLSCICSFRDVFECMFLQSCVWVCVLSLLWLFLLGCVWVCSPVSVPSELSLSVLSCLWACVSVNFSSELSLIMCSFVPDFVEEVNWRIRFGNLSFDFLVRLVSFLVVFVVVVFRIFVVLLAQKGQHFCLFLPFHLRTFTQCKECGDQAIHVPTARIVAFGEYCIVDHFTPHLMSSYCSVGGFTRRFTGTTLVHSSLWNLTKTWVGNSDVNEEYSATVHVRHRVFLHKRYLF